MYKSYAHVVNQEISKFGLSGVKIDTTIEFPFKNGPRTYIEPSHIDYWRVTQQSKASLVIYKDMTKMGIYSTKFDKYTWSQWSNG